jgi:hypothetical protein
VGYLLRPAALPDTLSGGALAPSPPSPPVRAWCLWMRHAAGVPVSLRMKSRADKRRVSAKTTAARYALLQWERADAFWMHHNWHCYLVEGGHARPPPRSAW